MESTMKYLINYINICLVLLIFVGSISNCFVFKIYSTVKFRKLSISIYFMASSLVDLIMVTVNLTVFYLRSQYNFIIQNQNNFTCKFFWWLAFAIGPISPWLSVTVSLDRFFNIIYPRKFPILTQLSIQISIIVGIILFNFLFYAQILLNFNWIEVKSVNVTDYGRGNCEMATGQTLFLMDLFNSTLVPFVFMIVLSGALIRGINEARKRTGVTNTNTQMRDQRFAITTVSLNLIFLLLNLPVVVFNILASYLTSIEPDLYALLFVIIVGVCYHSYFAISFFIQFGVNSMFRDEALRMVGLRTITEAKIRMETLVGQQQSSNLTRKTEMK